MNNRTSETPQMDTLMTSEKKWQIRSNQVATFVVLAGFIAGGIKYLNQRADDLKAQQTTAMIQAANAKRESQKPFLERQLNTCFSAVGIVGSLAAENEPGVIVNSKEYAKALKQFWIHFHGTLSVVENTAVEAAMVNLGEQLKECERNRTKCDLQNNANRLAHACRDLMRSDWNITEVQYNQ